MAAGTTALVASVVLLGWAFGFRSWTSIVPGTVPVHPITATLFGIAAIALLLSAGQHTLRKRNLGLICACVVSLAGLARLLAYAFASGSAADLFLFRETIQRIAAELAPIRIQMAPNSSINFMLVGASLLIIHGRWRRLRMTAFVLTLASMLLSLLTIGGNFIHVESLGSAIANIPMSLCTATTFIVLGIGVVAELFNPLWRALRTDHDATLGNARPVVGLSIDSGATVGFVAVVFLLLGIGIVARKGISQTAIDSHWDNHTYQVLAAINALETNLKGAESDARGYVITGENQFLDSWQTSIGALSIKLAAIKTLTVDNPVQQQRLVLLEPLIGRKIDVMRQQFRKENGSDVAHQTKFADEGQKAMDEFQRCLGEMEGEENRLLGERMLKTDSNAHRSILLITFGAGLALILVVQAGWLINRDIAGKARTETALRASETMFRGLLESAPDAVVIVNENGQVVLINAQAERMFGYTGKELHGRPMETIIPQRYLAEHVAKRDSYFAASVMRGTAVGQELRGIRKDGAEFPIEISLSPVHTPDGLLISSAIRDVTRHKQEAESLKGLNASLQARTAQLENSNKELESFSYSVSHDLRTPLRSIDGFSQALLEDNTGKLSADSEDNLRRVRAASQKMGHLIDDLLNLARVTRGEFAREKVDLSSIAGAIIKELRGSAPERTVDVVIADGLSADADPRLIHIVLVNLFANAWKFTGKCNHARIEFGCSMNQGDKEYYIHDNGAGFDMEHAARLFGAFQRLHGIAEFPGTGIGLATVQRIVQRHGGRIWADAKVDAGATFHFTL